MAQSKVFGIGLAKTGTTSLFNALKILGYNSIHEPKSWEDIERYEAITGIAIPFPYYELYERYPDSYFVLTTRNNDSWIKSVTRQFYKNKTKRSKIKIKRIKNFYGTYDFNPDIWINKKIEYEKNVITFFENKNFTILDLKDDDKWEKLCKLLNKEKPNYVFPHSNKTKG
jgi:hypothetical protein